MKDWALLSGPHISLGGDTCCPSLKRLPCPHQTSPLPDHSTLSHNWCRHVLSCNICHKLPRNAMERSTPSSTYLIVWLCDCYSGTVDHIPSASCWVRPFLPTKLVIVTEVMRQSIVQIVCLRWWAVGIEELGLSGLRHRLHRLSHVCQ